MVLGAGWKTKIRVPAWSGESLLPGHRLLTVSSGGSRGQGAPRVSYKGTNPNHDLSTSKMFYLLIPSHRALKFQHMHFRGIQKFRP